MTLYDIFPTQTIIDITPIKRTHDGNVESYGDFAQNSRRQINNLAVNGTDVPAILTAHVAGVVGSSVNIQSTLTNNDTNNQFEQLIKEHGKMFNFDITGRFDRNEGLRLIEWFKAMQGGVLIRYHYNSAWKIPMRTELIGVDRIDTAKYDKDTKNGLVKNRYGRVTHVWLYDDDDRTKSTRYSMKNIIYYSQVWMNLSQYTSVSRLVTILSTIGNTSDYFDAELKAAIERAKAGVYWSTELYSPIMDAFNKRMSKNTDESRTISEAKEIMSELAGRGVKPVGATPIPLDDKIHKINQNTSSVMDTFAQQSQKSIAASVGGSAVSTYKDIGIGNYASIKAAISFDEEGYKISFSQLVSTFINNYLERLFMVGVQIGRIDVNRESYFANREEYHSWDVLRVSKRSVDEKSAAMARAKDLETGATTLVREYGEKGLDYITEMTKQAKADADAEEIRQKIFKDRGLSDPQRTTNG